MKSYFFILVVIASAKVFASDTSGNELVAGLLNRAAPVDAETYNAGLKRLAAVDDTSGMQQYLYTAFWERTPARFTGISSGAILSVMRTSSEVDAEAIFKRGLMFASVGVKSHGQWNTNRSVAEFGYPRILMKFGDVLVAFEGFNQLSESEKASIIADLESGVLAWRTQKKEIIVQSPANDSGTRSVTGFPISLASQSADPENAKSSPEDSSELAAPFRSTGRLILWTALFIACIVFVRRALRQRRSRP